MGRIAHHVYHNGLVACARPLGPDEDGRESWQEGGGQEASLEFVVSHQYSSSSNHLHLEDHSARRPRSAHGALRESGRRPGVVKKGLGNLTAALTHSQLEYDELKRAIPQRVVQTPEQHRQQFCTLTIRKFDRPFVLAQQLRDSCRRWLLSKECDSEEVLDLVVLEQLITRLPEEMPAWVQCHQPELLDEATKLAEAHMAAYLVAEAPTQQTSLSFSLSLLIPAPQKKGALVPKPFTRSPPPSTPPLFYLPLHPSSYSWTPFSLCTGGNS
ncbi:hypothetical protein AOLI_G00264300 [Acnodon oligacanthus]